MPVSMIGWVWDTPDVNRFVHFVQSKGGEVTNIAQYPKGWDFSIRAPEGKTADELMVDYIKMRNEEMKPNKH